MMIIKRTLTETRLVDVEVSLPFYSKSENGYSYYWVFGEKAYMEVEIYEFNVAIAVRTNFMSDMALRSDRIQITEEEFRDAYSKAMKILESGPKVGEECKHEWSYVGTVGAEVCDKCGKANDLL